MAETGGSCLVHTGICLVVLLIASLCRVGARLPSIVLIGRVTRLRTRLALVRIISVVRYLDPTRLHKMGVTHDLVS